MRVAVKDGQLKVVRLGGQRSLRLAWLLIWYCQVSHLESK